MIAALLPPELERTLQRAVDSRELKLVASWAALESLLRSQPITAAIIDPSTDGGREGANARRLVAAYPSVEFVAYVPPTSLAFVAVAEMARAGIENVIVYRCDDSSTALRRVGHTGTFAPLTLNVRHALAEKMEQLPLPIRRIVDNVFVEPHLYGCAQDMATQSQVPLTRLYRAFRTARFSSPKQVLTAAKLLRGFVYLGDPGSNVTAVAAKLGYKNRRIFAEHSKEVFGMLPSQLRANLTEEEVLQRLSTWISGADDGDNESEFVATDSELRFAASTIRIESQEVAYS